MAVLRLRSHLVHFTVPIPLFETYSIDVFVYKMLSGWSLVYWLLYALASNLAQTNRYMDL